MFDLAATCIAAVTHGAWGDMSTRTIYIHLTIERNTKGGFANVSHNIAREGVLGVLVSWETQAYETRARVRLSSETLGSR
eukprot:COSAG02_NODE_47319_length_342_cov_0.646091_1_plen_79_part_10